MAYFVFLFGGDYSGWSHICFYQEDCPHSPFGMSVCFVICSEFFGFIMDFVFIILVYVLFWKN